MKKIIKFMLTYVFLALCFSANALELKGVKVDETAQVDGSALVLNGAGLRQKMVFKVYVAGLYLAQKTNEASAVINDSGNKRVSMYFLRELDAETLLKGMNEGFTDNNSATDMATIEPQMQSFRQMMTSAKEVKKGDVIVLDFTPAGTQVNINGKSLGLVKGEAFNKALLRVWLGNKPVDAALKKGMLGQ
jgi:Chalcone isomerase-like